MILRKSIAASAFCSSSSPLYRTLPPPPPRQSTTTQASCPSRPHRRWYATPRDNNHQSSHSDLPPWPSSASPTPYDIFAISRSDPYTKKRFYQLVKLYHPDLGHHPRTASLPPAVRVERYRLVVAANDLLSDPAKRHAYDAHGLGWVHSPRTSLRDVDRAWRHQPGSAAANATWEDWERWYEARGEGQRGRSQDPVYMPNGVFAMLVAMTCIIGAMLQRERAESAGIHYMEVKTQRDQAVGEEVRRSTRASAGLSQDERVGRFLRDRENVAFQFMPGRYEGPEEEEGNARHEPPS